MSTFLHDHPAVKLLLGVLALAAGLACLGWVLVSLARDASLWVLGRRTTGEILDLWAEQIEGSDPAQPAFRYYVRYRFATAQGELLTGVSQVAVGEWAGLGTTGQARVDPFDGREVPAAAPVYQEQEHVPPEALGGLRQGSPISIVYFPPYPQHNRLDESRYVPLLACTYVPFLIVTGIGLVGGWHLVQSARAAGGVS